MPVKNLSLLKQLSIILLRENKYKVKPVILKPWYRRCLNIIYYMLMPNIAVNVYYILRYLNTNLM